MGGKPYRCHFCGLGFMYKSTRKRHILNNVCGKFTPGGASEGIPQRGQLFKCSKCVTNFTNKKVFLLHVRLRKCADGLSNCGLSGVSELKPGDVTQNVSVSNTSRNEVGASGEGVADKCSVVIERNDEMCIVCRKVFASKMELEIHMKEHVIGKELSSSTRIQNPDELPEDKQLKPDNLTCRECGTNVKSAKALRRHILQHTGKIRCTVCDRAFAKHFLLKRHMKVHFRQGLHSNVFDSGHLKYYKSSSIPKSYCCKICNKRFSKKCNLASHLRAHRVMHPSAGPSIQRKEIDEGVGSEIAVFITEQPDEGNTDFRSDTEYVADDEENTTVTADPLDEAFQCNEATTFTTVSPDEDAQWEMENNSYQARVIEDSNPDHVLGRLCITDHSETSLDNNQKSRNETHFPMPSDSVQSVNSSDQVSESDVNSTVAEMSCREQCPSGSNTASVHNRKDEVTVYITEKESVTEELREFNGDDVGDRSDSSVDPLQKDSDENYGLSFELDRAQSPNSFSSPPVLGDHIRSHKYPAKNSLRKRHNADHGSHPKYKCSVCWRDFLFDSDLAEHMKTHESSFSCNVCGKKFQTNYGLLIHFRLHKGLHHGNKSSEVSLVTSSVIASSVSSVSSSEENIGHGSAELSPAPQNESYCVKDTEGTFCSVPPNIVRKNSYQEQEEKDLDLRVNNAFACIICGNHFQTKAALISHSKIHKRKRSFSCDFCSETFLSQSSLRIHKSMYKHRLYGSATDKSKIATTSGNLSELAVMESSYNLETEFPSNSMQDSSEVKRQTFGENIIGTREALHTFPEQGSTNQCELGNTSDTQGNDADDSINEEDEITSGSELFCSFCGKMFKNRRGFTAHLKSHSGYRPFPCRDCNQRFLCLSSLRAHQSRARHGKKSLNIAEENEINDRILSNNEMESTLRSSSISMESEQENLVHQQFSVSFEKQINILDVAGDQDDEPRSVPQDTVSCSICDKSFKNKGGLGMHLKGHTKNRPFACDFCGQRFLSFSSLRLHKYEYKHVHGNEKIIETSENSGMEEYVGIPGSVLHSSKVEEVSGYKEPCFITEENAAQYKLPVPSDSQFNDTFVEDNRFQNEMSRVSLQSDVKKFAHGNEKESGGLFCSFCGKTFKQKGGLAVHLKTHSGDRPFSCDFCDETFLSERTLKRHQSKFGHRYNGRSFTEVRDAPTLSENDPQTSSLLLQSSEIPHTQSSLSSNEERDESVEGKLRNGLTCKVCGKIAKNKTGYKAHVQMHSGYRPFSCPVCILTFATVNGLRTHQSKSKHRHPGKLKFKRKRSHMKLGNVKEGSSTSLLNSVKSHQEIARVSKMGTQSMSYVDRQSTGSNASEFKETFSSATEVENTTQPVNDQSYSVSPSTVGKSDYQSGQKHSCSVCNVTFLSESALLSHSEVHTAGRTLSCNHCRKTFLNWNSCRRHRYRCRKLKDSRVMNPSNKGELSLRNEEELKFRKRCICPVCRKQCKTRNGFVNHLKSHPGVRPYQCSICEVTFFSKKNLYLHEVAHITTVNLQENIEISDEISISEKDLMLNANEANSSTLNTPLESTDKTTDYGHQSMEEITSTDAIEHTNADSTEKRFIDDVSSEEQMTVDKSSQKNVCAENQPLSCTVCDMSFTSIKAFMYHQDTHGNEEIINTCTICKKEFETRVSLAVHLRIHIQTRLFCSICNAIFLTNKMLRVHMKKHKRVRLHTCNVCQLTFSKYRVFVKHRKMHKFQKHTADDMECTNVDSTENRNIYDVSSENQMTVDESAGKNVCAENQPLSCSLCSMSFTSIKTFMYHQDTHENEEIKNTCTICNKEFETRLSLAVHLRIHIQTRLFCRICNGVFLSNKMLRVHMKKHKKVQLHTCNICQLTFSKYKAYVKHKIIHKNRHHICPICDKKFASGGNLKRHIRAHSSIWDCPLCEVKTLRGGNFGLHMMRKHGIQRVDVNAYKTVASKIPNKLDDLPGVQDFDVEFRDQQRSFLDCAGNKLVHREMKTEDSDSPSSTVDVEEFQEDKDDNQFHRSQPNWKDMSNHCNVCGLAFFTRISFVKHARLHINLDLKCVICETDFTDAAVLDKHIDTHSKDQMNEVPEMDHSFPSNCNICGQIMSDSREYTSHLQVHMAAKSSQDQFYDRSERDVPPGINSMSLSRRYPCHKCNKILPTRKSLYLHLQKHRRSKVFSCDVCGKEFKKKSLLASHATEHSQKSFRGMCQVFLSGHDFDNSLMKSKPSLNNLYEGYIGEPSTFEDTKNSAGSKPITPAKDDCLEDDASECQIDEENSAVMENKITDSDLKVSCSSNEFGIFPDTTRNEKPVISTSDKDGGANNLPNKKVSDKESYVCSVCNKSFSRYQKLVSHEQIHLEPLLYDCDKCAKSFVSEAEYDAHRKTHLKTSVICYECPICDLKVLHLANFTRHFESHGVSAAFLNIEDVIVSDGTDIPKDIENTEISNAVRVKQECNVDDGNPNQSDLTSVKDKLLGCSSNALISNAKASLESNSSELEVDASKLCNICGKVFSKRIRCKEHIFKHSSKDYKCKVCPKRFIRRIDFFRHQKDHDEQIVNVRDNTVKATTHADVETFAEAVKDPLRDVYGFDGDIPSSKVVRRKIKNSDSEVSINSCQKCNQNFADYKSLLKHSTLHMEELQRKCLICEEEFMNRGNMVQHMKVHNYCVPCEREFPSKKLFREHYREHKRSSGTLHKPHNIVKKQDARVDRSAPVSSASGVNTNDSRPNASSYLLDVKTVFRKEYDKFKCNICNRVIKCKRYLKKHMEVHSQHLPFKCNMCPKRTASLTRMNRHKKTHSSTTRYTCKVCNRVFDFKSNWKRHLINVHKCQSHELVDIGAELASEEREMQSHAGKQASTVAVDGNNDDVKEGEQKDFLKDRYGDDWACFTCKKLFSNSDKLRIHMLSNSCNKEHQQEQVDPFSTQGSGNKVLECRESNYSGNILPAVQTDDGIRVGALSQSEHNTVKVKKLLKKNRVNVSSQKYSEGISKAAQSGNYLTCPECGKVCIGQYRLDDHLITHSADKPFKCTICSTAFKRVFDMRRHMRNYHSYDPKSSTADSMREEADVSYKCPICYKTFLYDSFLKSHMLLHSRDKNQGDMGEEELYECAVERNDEDDMHELEPDGSYTNTSLPEYVMVEDIAIDIKEEIIEGDIEEEIEDITIEDFDVFDYVHTENTESTPQPFLSSIESKPTVNKKITKGVHKKLCRDEIFINKVGRSGSGSKKFDRCGTTSISQDHFSENSSDDEHFCMSEGGGLSSEKVEFHATSNFKEKADIEGFHLSKDTKNIYCRLCNMSYESTLALLQHARSHVGCLFYECDCCKKIFDNGKMYKNHFMVHVEEFIDCRYTTCAKIPVEDRPLPSSIPAYCRRKETLEKTCTDSTYKHQCIICGKTFTSERKLVGHKHVHYKLYYRACETCGKSFSSHEASRFHRFQHLTVLFSDASGKLVINNDVATSKLNRDLTTGDPTNALVREESASTLVAGDSTSASVAGDSTSASVARESTSSLVRGESTSASVRGETTSSIVTGESTSVSFTGDSTSASLKGESTSVLFTGDSTSASVARDSTSVLFTRDSASALVARDSTSAFSTEESSSNTLSLELKSSKVIGELNSDTDIVELNCAEVTGEINSDTVFGELASDADSGELKCTKVTRELNRDTVAGKSSSDKVCGDLHSDADTRELASDIETGKLSSGIVHGELNSDAFRRELGSDKDPEELNSSVGTAEFNSDVATKKLYSDTFSGDLNRELSFSLVAEDLNSDAVTGELNSDMMVRELSSDIVTGDLNSDAVIEEPNSVLVGRELHRDMVTRELNSDLVTGKLNNDMVVGELISDTITRELSFDAISGDRSRISSSHDQHTFSCSFCGKQFESLPLCEEHKKEHFDQIELDIGELANDSFMQLLGESVICNDEI